MRGLEPSRRGNQKKCVCFAFLLTLRHRSRPLLVQHHISQFPEKTRRTRSVGFFCFGESSCHEMKFTSASRRSAGNGFHCPEWFSRWWCRGSKSCGPSLSVSNPPCCAPASPAVQNTSAITSARMLTAASPRWDLGSLSARLFSLRFGIYESITLRSLKTLLADILRFWNLY